MGKAARKLIFVNECIQCFENQLFATKVKNQQKITYSRKSGKYVSRLFLGAFEGFEEHLESSETSTKKIFYIPHKDIK